MNSLSWFIYLADVVESIKVTSILVAMIGGIAFAFYALARLATGGEFPKWNGLKWGIGGCAFAVFLAVVMPSHKTMIMIASSELGEKVTHSEQVKGIVDPGLDLVKNWIKKEAHELSEGSFLKEADKLAKENGK
jgi:hypothetical protein